MTAITVSAEQAAPSVPLWAVALVALALGLLYLVSFEAGPVSTTLGQGAAFLHETFHDGRHLLGVPCH